MAEISTVAQAEFIEATMGGRRGGEGVSTIWWVQNTQQIISQLKLSLTDLQCL